MLKKYGFILIALLALTLYSCSKESKMVNATVVDSGDITYAGCGYLFQLEDSALIKPIYIPGAYQHDGIKVKIEYHHTGIKDTCDYGAKIYDMIKIDKIENRTE